ncbi:hypothetical protein cyc_03728 [Cyclospora cayetanensis]|uniref:Uncharacterized protein n=1 Tax=Cyclospora cayetanensis TaxID=88456 RepID=A0A1D3D9U6_9EIME|nr:hypothetical protein cyc_03728 [Cyclospora cayetanensis]
MLKHVSPLERLTAKPPLSLFSLFPASCASVACIRFGWERLRKGRNGVKFNLTAKQFKKRYSITYVSRHDLKKFKYQTPGHKLRYVWRLRRKALQAAKRRNESERLLFLLLAGAAEFETPRSTPIQTFRLLESAFQRTLAEVRGGREWRWGWVGWFGCCCCSRSPCDGHSAAAARAGGVASKRLTDGLVPCVSFRRVERLGTPAVLLKPPHERERGTVRGRRRYGGGGRSEG